MFIKLRNRLLRLIMAITSLMLVGAFVLVFSSMQISLFDTYSERLSYTSSVTPYFLFESEDVPTEAAAAPASSIEGNSIVSVEPVYSVEAVGGVAQEVVGVEIVSDSSSLVITEFQQMPTFSAFVSVDGVELSLAGVEVYGGPYSNQMCSAMALRVIDEVMTPLPEEGIEEVSGVIREGLTDWKYAVVAAPRFPEYYHVTSALMENTVFEESVSEDSTGVAFGTDTARMPTGEYFQVNFINTSEDAAMTTTLIVTLVVVGCLMLGIIFLISRFFANRAIRPIEEMWEQQTRFVANASHELKTPLATMMASHDLVMMSPEATVASQGEWLGNIRGGMDRMQRLITGLLTLAQAEEGDVAADEEVDVARIISEELDALSEVEKTRQLSVRRELEEGVIIRASADMLREVIKILSENSLAYVDEKGEVSVALARAGSSAKFTISNTGPGISKEDLEHVFERFYRADKARSSAEPTDASGEHYGLGLSIARSLVEQMGGKISAESIPGVNTTFTVLLDLAS